MFLQACLLIAALTTVTNAAIAAPVTFPISNALCPLLPEPEESRGICSPFTHRSCDSPTASCPFCAPQSGAALLDFTGYVDPPKDYVVDVENYLFYHMLHAEYLVEFSKKPMPFQTALALPHCGINSNPNRKREFDEARLDRRGGWPKFPSKVGGTLGQIGEGIKHGAKEIGKGLAAIREYISHATMFNMEQEGLIKL